MNVHTGITTKYSRHFSWAISTLQAIHTVIQFNDRDSNHADQHIHNYADYRARNPVYSSPKSRQ